MSPDKYIINKFNDQELVVLSILIGLIELHSSSKSRPTVLGRERQTMKLVHEKPDTTNGEILGLTTAMARTTELSNRGLTVVACRCRCGLGIS